MKFNTIIKKSIAVSSLALLATACKPGLNNNEDAYLFAIASSQIRGLAEGNCAISINHAGLTYGAYVNVAINDGNVGGLNTALAGLNAATQGVFSAVAGGANVARFTQANFEAAIGSTVAELGYANYAAVPYNVKYDAFFTERGDWTADKRNALLNFSKTFMDSFSPWPILGINSDGTAFGAALNGLTGT
ncbi:MAG: hypothetical protein JJT78_09695, partial [Leptospira sp.]|nr:hypothetical protein [Leptospira sp.]